MHLDACSLRHYTRHINRLADRMVACLKPPAESGESVEIWRTVSSPPDFQGCSIVICTLRRQFWLPCMTGSLQSH